MAGAASRLTSTERRGARPWRPPAPALSTSTAHSVSPGSNSTSTPLSSTMRGASAVSIWPATSSMSKVGIGPLRHGTIIEHHLLERGAVVAQRPRDGIALARHARRELGRRLQIERKPAQLLPALHDVERICAQDVERRAGRRGAQHHPALEQILDMGAQAIAFGLALDAAREGNA